MNVDLFDFDLPRQLIASRPAEPRDRSRLLRVEATGLSDRVISDLPGLLRSGDLLIANDTKVIPARLSGQSGKARVAVTLIEDLGHGDWRAFARPAKNLRPGALFQVAPDFSAEVRGRGEGGEVTLRFAQTGAAMQALLQRYGRLPLPPYIKRPAGADRRDDDDYQTLFASRPGAVAAPTAGLHFTPQLRTALVAAGIGVATLTLHVGAGTFLPVTVADTSLHRMHGEWGELSQDLAEQIAVTRRLGGRIVAVGSTAARLLETASGADGAVRAFRGRTDIFITPGYRFQAVDLMLTNFHLPRSTLFMLVAAFAGLDEMRAAYRHAIDQGYRFFSYGDACLLERRR
jgi:S-adenosylmethionine:tRNA ribosyltransferase-isomerase